VVVSPSCRKRDGLLESETWDYLRDSLLLIFTRHYFCDEEPIALAVAPSVCFAMTCLFCTAGPQASAGSLESYLVGIALISDRSRSVYVGLSVDDELVCASQGCSGRQERTGAVCCGVEGAIEESGNGVVRSGKDPDFAFVN